MHTAASTRTELDELLADMRLPDNKSRPSVIDMGGIRPGTKSRSITSAGRDRRARSADMAWFR